MSHGRTKVVFVIGALTVGGTERQLIGILKHLDRNLFEPHLFTFYAHGELVSQVPDDVICFCDQTDNPIAKTKPHLPGSIHRRLVASLRRYCQQHSIDVAYDRTYHVSLITGAACQAIGIPYINTVVSDPYTDFFPTAGPFSSIKYWRLRKIYAASKMVLCVSEGVRQAASSFYRLPLATFTTCYNFVDAERVAEIEIAAEKRNAIPSHQVSTLGTIERPLRIVAIGRLHPQKNVISLIHAVKQLVELHNLTAELTLVGDGPERDFLASTAIQLEIADRVRFTGTVNNPTDYLVAADVYCLPSIGEGMPNSLIEALWMGVPAVAADCPHGPNEIAESGRWAELFPTGDTPAMVNTLVEFSNQPKNLQEKANGASDSMRDRFSPSEGIERLQDFLLQK